MDALERIREILIDFDTMRENLDGAYAELSAKEIKDASAKPNAAQAAPADKQAVLAALVAFAKSLPTPTNADGTPKLTPLNPWQWKFAAMLAALIYYAYEIKGHRLTLGSAWSAPGNTPAHKANSLHFDRLAIDLNLFKFQNGKWVLQEKTADHSELGKFWQSIGGAWGGEFNDGNHYSLQHGVRK